MTGYYTELTYLKNEAANDANNAFKSWVKYTLSTEDREILESAEGSEDYEAVLDEMYEKYGCPF